MTALVIIDVQRDILAVPGAARAVVGERFAKVRERLAELIGRAHAAHRPVIFIQHDGPAGHRLETGTPGWELIPTCRDTRATSSFTRRPAIPFTTQPCRLCLRNGGSAIS